MPGMDPILDEFVGLFQYEAKLDLLGHCGHLPVEFDGSHILLNRLYSPELENRPLLQTFDIVLPLLKVHRIPLLHRERLLFLVHYDLLHSLYLPDFQPVRRICPIHINQLS